VNVDLDELRRLRRARDRMDREYAQPLDVLALARTALMSPAHFSRRFRDAYGETPYAYLMTRRIERAKALLRRGDLSVTDICFAVGWTSLGSFSARFTELVGEPPSSYRARNHDELRATPSCLAMVLTRPRKDGPRPDQRVADGGNRVRDQVDRDADVRQDEVDQDEVDQDEVGRPSMTGLGTRN
jgi:AraC-like DNA-binding protein